MELEPYKLYTSELLPPAFSSNFSPIKRALKCPPNVD